MTGKRSPCVVCMAPSDIFCVHDDAFLCGGCSKKIHTANALAARHEIRPLCGVCNVAASTVYCHNDRAFLCGSCDVAVHSANPLPHHTVPAREAPSLQKQDQVPLVALESTDEVSGTHEPAEAVPPAAELVSQLPRTARPRRQVQAQAAPAQDVSLGHGVPEVPEVLPTKHDVLGKGKDFDFWELDNQWLDRLDMGFDFTDILGNAQAQGALPDDADHLVPSLSAGFVDQQEDAVKEVTQQPAAEDFDFSAVPFSLPSWLDQQDDVQVVPQVVEDAPEVEGQEDADMVAPCALPITTAAVVGIGASGAARRPPPKRNRSTASLDSDDEEAVVPTYRAPLAGPHIMMRAAAQVAAATIASAVPRDGSNMTRAERVARYLEKKKHRKFEKTIRYASRKAYAEVRPRIKGRFATKEEVEAWERAKAMDPNAPLLALS